MFDPGAVVGIADRCQSHEALDLALEPVGGSELFGQAREGRIIDRDLRLHNKVLLFSPIAGIDPESSVECGLIRGPFPASSA